ncbi:MAG TPA: FAD-dependent oxidoreductase [bacterium]|nr:FAD-dependent oxidoreductase [bacterium]
MSEDREHRATDPGTLHREKWEFLRLGAHQLRSPLATIHTQLQTILGGYTGEVAALVRQLLEGAERKSRDLLNTVTEMLELARLADAEHEPTYEPADLEQIVTGVREAIESKAAARGVQFICAILSKLPVGWARPGGLRHIIFNLFENAVKYTPAGGTVDTFLIYHTRQRRLEGRVSDTGIGIPADALFQLFTEFFRAANARHEEREGTGLGLAIVKRIIDSHSGEITVVSDPGKGTTFTFSIPLNCVSAQEQAEYAAQAQKPRRRIVVIGGRTAGPKAAAKALRLDPEAEITLIERDRTLSYAGCGLPYYISGLVNDPRELMATPDGDLRDPDFFRRVKGIAVYNRTECTAIDRARREISVTFRKSGGQKAIPYDALILATGGRPALPPIEGLTLKNVFTLNRIEDARGLRAALAGLPAREAVIIGGGLLGMECAEAVVARGLRVTIIEARDRALPMLDPELSLLVAHEYARHGVRILPGERVVRLAGSADGAVTGVVTAARTLPADLVLLGTGVAPETTLARQAGLALGATGGIAVNEWLQTSDPDIFAIGDCVENTDIISGRKLLLPLGSVANRQGRVAGANAVKLAETFPGVVGTMILKGFDLNIGSTGLSETEAAAAGFAPLAALTAGYDREHYFPTAAPVVVKIVGDAASGRLLGVQAVGRGDISKRLDVAAALLAAKESVDTLSKLDLGYAPPYSTAIDIIGTAANVWKNKFYQRFNGISSIALQQRLAAGGELLVVDVRNPGDYATGAIPGALSVPLRSLRGRLHELPRDRALVLSCATGLNAYEAARVLQSQGFDRVEILEGGMAAWPFAKA